MTKGQNLQSNREHNRVLVLKLIKKHGPILRKEIADITGLTKSAVTKIVNPLIEAKIVIESYKTGVAERKKALSLRSGQNYIVAIYMGRIKLTGAVFDLDGQMIYREELFEGVKIMDNQLLPENVCSLINSVIRSSGIDPVKIVLIGIAAPGAINSKEGFIFELKESSLDTQHPIPFNWQKIKLIDFIKNRFNIPVLIDNNSNLAALAEYWFGVGLKARNFILYSIGVGCGAGAIINGQLYRGQDNIVCEIGHTSINYKGERCFCGNKGCLELEGSFHKIVERYRREKGIHLNNIAKKDISSLTAEVNYIIQKADEGEKVALKVIKDISEILGVGAVTLVNLFNPEMIVVAKDNIDDVNIGIFVKNIAQYVKKHAYSIIVDEVKVVESELGNDIQLYGAYAMILQYVLENYRLLDRKKCETKNINNTVSDLEYIVNKA